MYQPLGNKVLVRDIVETEKKTEAGVILMDAYNVYKKVKIEALSPDSVIKFMDKSGDVKPLQVGDICLSDKGGVELEKGLFLMNDGLLQCRI